MTYYKNNYNDLDSYISINDIQNDYYNRITTTGNGINIPITTTTTTGNGINIPMKINYPTTTTTTIGTTGIYKTQNPLNTQIYGKYVDVTMKKENNLDEINFRLRALKRSLLEIDKDKQILDYKILVKLQKLSDNDEFLFDDICNDVKNNTYTLTTSDVSKLLEYELNIISRSPRSNFSGDVYNSVFKQIINNYILAIENIL